MAINEAKNYGVLIQETADQSRIHWSAELVTHLAPDENRGRHNVFVDVVDKNGGRIRDDRLRIGWTWEGKRPNEAAPPKPLDKPDYDDGHGNVDIYAAQTLSIWIHGDGLDSDIVSGIHTRHPDEPGPNGEKWNSYGHHSFYIRFVRVDGIIQPPPIDPDDPDLAALSKRIDALSAIVQQQERDIANLEADILALRTLLRQWTGD